jgi:hypothetical protein
MQYWYLSSIQILAIRAKAKTMNDLKSLPLATLVDMLSARTRDYTKMLRSGTSTQEYDACKKMINSIMAEIESRKRLKDHTEGEVPQDFNVDKNIKSQKPKEKKEK